VVVAGICEFLLWSVGAGERVVWETNGMEMIGDDERLEKKKKKRGNENTKLGPFVGFLFFSFFYLFYFTFLRFVLHIVLLTLDYSVMGAQHSPPLFLRIRESKLLFFFIVASHSC